MSRVFIRNKTGFPFTENRPGIGFVNIPKGERWEAPDEETAKAVVLDSKNGGLAIEIEAERPRVLKREIPTTKVSIRRVGSGGITQANK